MKHTNAPIYYIEIFRDNNWVPVKGSSFMYKKGVLQFSNNLDTRVRKRIVKESTTFTFIDIL